ncbi:MAG TPA: hypothetical protein ENL22_02980 [candidate division Zixibacteria bacterium]|nr:hypothetical protein [candidate division Zixibacteria bacterium]
MKQITGKYKIVASARIIIIAVALLSIILSGSSLITIRALDPDRTDIPKTSENKTRLSLDVNLPVGGNAVAGRMPFGSGKAIFYTIPAVFSLYNLNESRPITKATELRPNRNINLHFYERLTTAASISPEKAREFTLVGAKPSGTS